MDPPPGYAIGFVPPPPPTYPAIDPSQPMPEISSSIQLSEDDVLEALKDWVAADCCKGDGPLKGLKVKDIRAVSVFNYKLETYTEQRSSKLMSEPYLGQDIINGMPPQPWEVHVPNQAEMYQDMKVEMEVPFSASIKPCTNCQAGVELTCKDCDGRGEKTCTKCNGSGSVLDQFQRSVTCDMCNSAGVVPCTACNESGSVPCEQCQGRGHLRCYVQLTVERQNHERTAIIGDKTDVPAECVTDAKGQQVYFEEAPRVMPMVSFPPDVRVFETSQQLVPEETNLRQSNAMIIMQRQTVTTVPMTKVKVSRKDDDDEEKFYIYGEDKQIHFPDYWSQTCGCCTIM